MTTCNACKYWTPTHPHADCQLGRCSQIIVANMPYCSLTIVARATDEQMQPPRDVRPMTPFNFGCIHWEQKPSPPARQVVEGG